MAFNLFSRIRLSLRWKFLIALSSVILVLIPLGAYLFISESLQVLDEEAIKKAEILKDNLRNKGIAMTRNIALNITSAVAGSDFTFLQDVITSTVASDKEIYAAIIMNQEGRALVHSDPLKSLKTLRSVQDNLSREVKGLKVFNYEEQGENILEVAIPILSGEERWGTLRVAYTLKFLNEEIRKSRIRQRQEIKKLTRTAIVIAVLSMVGATLLAMTFSRHIVNAVGTIVRTTQKVAHGDFSPRVEIKTGDELETMGTAINKMAQDLANLNKEVIKKTRMESELRTAEMVQQKIMPREDPKYPGLELAAFFRSASETGGDWFTYLMQPDGETLSVIIADVTGHGLPAALITEAAHSCFRTILTLNPKLGPGEILRYLNQVLIPQMDRQYGMTAFVSNIKLATLEMEYSNAGHNMPLIRVPQDGDLKKAKVSVLAARGVRLGDSMEDRFEEKRLNLKPQTLLFWYTDGILDCVNEQGQNYGKKRLLATLREYSHETSIVIRDALKEEILNYIGEVEQPDDVTFIVGKVGEPSHIS